MAGDQPTSRTWRLRCRVYLAYLGDRGAALDLARDAVILAFKNQVRFDEGETAVQMVRVALGWLDIATTAADFTYLGDATLVQLWDATPPSNPSSNGYVLVGLIEEWVEAKSKRLAAAAAAKIEGNDAVAKAAVPEPPPTATPPAAVVFGGVGNTVTGEGKNVEKEFTEFVGKALPLVPMPDLTRVRATLQAEFPYAAEVIDRVLIDVPARSYVHLRPTILVGAPGCGKSRFARRLLTVLGMAHDVIPCGGVSDGAFAGTARRWSTGEPSLPVALITRYKTAGPGAFLDEIEKVGSSRHNGQVHDALLAFLERETASRFHDPYLQSPCDLSHVTWLMTANALDGVPAPLRDRCRIIPFTEPGHEHLAVLTHHIMIDILAEQGLDHRWVSPLDRVEMAAVAETWPGGSLRTLRRMNEVALMSRDVKH